MDEIKLNLEKRINISKLCEIALNIINNAGHESWLVGGYLRNAIIDCFNKNYDYIKYPDNSKNRYIDIDIATSASWQEIKKIFEKENWIIYELGTKFGTIGVLPPKKSVYYNNFYLEITTFRKEKKYSDGRHPNIINKANSIYEDLKRRDFTINSIAYSLNNGIVDPYGGISDINKEKIRCIGCPKTRFNEDNLRILRAIRFASQLNFNIEKNTEKNLFKYKYLLNNVSMERKRNELSKLLIGINVKNVLLNYKEIIFELIKELRVLDGFEQHSKYHCYDIYKHTIYVVDKIKIFNEKSISKTYLNMINTVGAWSALLHDIGKPDAFFMENDGVGHFYGHALYSTKISRKILKKFKFSKKFIESVCLLIKMHDYKLYPNKKSIQKFLLKFDCSHTLFDQYWMFKIFCNLRKADSLAHSKKYQSNYPNTILIEKIFKQMYEENLLISKQNLKINGDSIKKLNIKEGPIYKLIIDACLNAIAEEKIQNNETELKNFVINLLKNKEDLWEDQI